MHEKAVLGTMFQTVFTPCLQIPLTYKDKKLHISTLEAADLQSIYKIQ